MKSEHQWRGIVFIFMLRINYTPNIECIKSKREYSACTPVNVCVLALCRAASCASRFSLNPQTGHFGFQCYCVPRPGPLHHGSHDYFLLSKKQCKLGFCLTVMTPPHMAQQVDLGQCLLRASNSRLQLQFAATAHFSNLPSQGGCLPVKVSQWQDLPSLWVTEAPELYIRLFIRATHGLEHAVSALVAELREKLCSSPV